MPIYEYRCDTCGAKTELLRAMGQADDPVMCQSCRQIPMRRVISVFHAQSNQSGSPNVSMGPGSCACGGPPGSCAM